MRIFVDMDGVLSDFDSHFKSYTNTPPEDFVLSLYKMQENIVGQRVSKDKLLQTTDLIFWKVISEMPDFWSTMTPIDGFKNLWQSVSAFDPIILTSIPLYPFVSWQAVLGKRQWIDKFISKHIRMYVTFFDHNYKKTYKHHFCQGLDDILIDNTPENILAWQKAGGTGILFENVEQAIKDLKMAFIRLQAQNEITYWMVIKNTFKQIFRSSKKEIVLGMTDQQLKVIGGLDPEKIQVLRKYGAKL